MANLKVFCASALCAATGLVCAVPEVVTDVSGYVTLTATDPEGAKDSRSVTVRYPQMPYLGIWHLPKQEVDYVCIEPWMTLPARQDVIEVFEEKLDNIVLAPGKTYVNNWDITIR